MDYKLLWAKTEPYHPLWCHMLDIAAVARVLMRRFGGIAPLPDEWVLYLVAMHDIGKADACFQNKDATQVERLRLAGFILPDTGTQSPRFRHEARSAEIILEELLNYGWDEQTTFTISAAVRGHHGNFESGSVEGEYYRECELPKRVAVWDPLRREISGVLLRTLGVPEYVLSEFDNHSVAGVRLTGLTVLADWIASNSDVYRYSALPVELPADAYYTAALNEAEAAVGSLAFDVSPGADAQLPPVSFREVFPEIIKPRQTQLALESLCMSGLPPGLLILEAPMGVGKTECALYVADHWRRTAGAKGAYFALPTMATSNQMHGRCKEFLSRANPGSVAPRLIHGMAWLLEDDTPLNAPRFGDATASEDERAAALDWFRNSKRAILAPDGVGTVDQALRAVLHVKHGFLRLFGLTSRVLVIDEVHAYDEYMTTLMEMLLRWCRALQIPVILLSATLSKRQKERLVGAYGGRVEVAGSGDKEPYPLITCVDMAGNTRPIPVDNTEAPRTLALKKHHGALNDATYAAHLARSLVAESGCVCVIANTVKHAQEIFEILVREAGPECKLMLYHARFRAEERQEIEEEVIRLFGKDSGNARPTRAILVATQVVEQSLDVDFDAMITQLAPIDLLLQRSGRVHRHAWRIRPERHKSPVLHVLLPPEGAYDQFGGSGFVYEHEPLIRTQLILADNETLQLPKDFRPLIEHCYSPVKLSEDADIQQLLSTAADQASQQHSADSKIAENFLIPEPVDVEFKLANKPSPGRDAEEGQPATFLRPQTRLGSNTTNVLLLHDDDMVEAALSPVAPTRKMLRKLFLQKVSLPNWWFLDVVPLEPNEVSKEEPRWLRGHKVIVLKDNAWHGRDIKGRQVVVLDKPRLGVVYLQEGGEIGDI